MNTRFLESFVAVIDSGSIAEAARRLNLTPAAIAQRIRALESEMGARLLSRSGRTATATEAGSAILVRARTLLSDVRDLKSVAANDRPAGELRLGTLPSTISSMLPDVLRRLTRKYPQIEVSITPGMAPDLYRKVLDGDLDAAFIVQPPFAIPKACGWQMLRAEPFIVLTPQSMANRKPLEILASEPFIRTPRKGWSAHLVEVYLRKVNVRPRVLFELAGLEAVWVLVDRGLGVSFVPDWEPPWVKGLSLAKFPVRDKSFVRRIGLIWMRSSARVRLVRALLEETA